jgi:hypothetical protein
VAVIMGDLSQISILGLLSENRLSRNQLLTTPKKLTNRNLRQIRLTPLACGWRCEVVDRKGGTG